MVAVVEHRDVPAPAQQVQKLHQRPRPLGKLEAVDALVGQRLAAPAHHVADMQLGGFVVGHVHHLEMLALQVGQQVAPAVERIGDLHADEDLGALRVAIAVVELGNIALAQGQRELAEAARLLVDGHGQHGLALLAQFGALGDMAQPVEVHIGAGHHRHQGLAGECALSDIFLQARHGHGAGRLGDGARVVEHVLHSGADLVGGDGHHLVHQLAQEAEGLLADLGHGHAIGEQAHLGEQHAASRLQGRLQTGRVLGLDGNQADLGADVLQIGGHAGHQPAPAHWHEQGIQRRAVLAGYLQTHGALTGNHFCVIEGMHEGVALLVHQGLRVGRRLVVGIPVQHDLATQGLHGVDLDGGRGDGHDDDGLDAQPRAGHGHALGMIAGRGCDHAFARCLGGKPGHAVVGAAQLEAVHGLHVLALQQDVVVQTLGEDGRLVDRRLDGDVIDSGRQNGFYILFHR